MLGLRTDTGVRINRQGFLHMDGAEDPRTGFLEDALRTKYRPAGQRRAQPVRTRREQPGEGAARAAEGSPRVQGKGFYKQTGGLALRRERALPAAGWGDAGGGKSGGPGRTPSGRVGVSTGKAAASGECGWKGEQ